MLRCRDDRPGSAFVVNTQRPRGRGRNEAGPGALPRAKDGMLEVTLLCLLRKMSVKSGAQVWSILFFLLLTFFASTCLNNSRNLGTAF